MRVSIVICTDGRAASLEATLRSLRQLNYDDFEVCVVYGPTPDGTAALLSSYPNPIKRARNPHQNLSQSRNLGIAMAAGEVVAFLDDDSIPEPEWLDDIVAAYADPSVGGAGGFVHDHTGVGYQCRFATTNRLGRADVTWTRAVPEWNFPLSANFPHLLGANSSFRRSALISVRGFDEEYEYWLDETDLACRLIDGGWHIAQIEGAYVHHKFLPSTLRTKERVLRSWYPVFKNKIYYSLVNRHGFHTIYTAIEDGARLIKQFRQEMEWAIGQRHLGVDARGRFEGDVERAWEVGLARGLLGRRRLMPQVLAELPPPPFRPFLPAPRQTSHAALCFMTQEYPPTAVGGVGRYVHQLARAIAERGHQVHVLTRGEGNDRVDLEEGVWVHRVVPRSDGDAPPATATGQKIPEHIWHYSSTMLREIRRIAARRKVACIYAPIWDCEGVAVLRDGRFPLVLGLQTMLRAWMASHPHRVSDPAFAQNFISPMLSLEAELMQQAGTLNALSAALVEEIERSYGVTLRDRASVIPLGLDDFAAMPSELPPPIADVDVRILFVGRLEERKGIDVLLAIVPELLARCPRAGLDIVGNDSIAGADGRTYRQAFEAQALPDGLRRRVVFHGEVSEASLRGFYRGCDVFVAPSRFESFGLILVEAMMFAKPVIGCRAGGMREIVLDGETGFLAEPGDAASLLPCLTQLIDDAGLRRRMGAAGRARYETHFTTDRMAEAVLGLMLQTEKVARKDDRREDTMAGAAS